MKKWICKCLGIGLLAIAVAIALVPAFQSRALDKGEDFVKNGDILVSYTGTAKAVSVPAGIRIIQAEAFSNQNNIQSISFPSSLKVIENGAFRSCENLQKVTFNEGLETVESGAFAMCKNLTEVNFSNTVCEIGAGVFAGDEKLYGVNLGKNPYYYCKNGVLYSADGKTLIQYFPAGHPEEFVMSDNIINVERYAFWGCKDLEKVTLSANLELVPEYAFSNCTDLKDISFPYSIRKIGAKSFEDCKKLTSISIPPTVSYIHPTAFDGCTNVRIVAQEGSPAYEFYQTFSASLAESMENTQTVSDNAIGSLYLGDESSDDESEDEDVSQEEENPYAVGKYNPNRPSDVSDLNVSDYYAVDSPDLIGKSRVVGNEAVIWEKIDSKKDEGTEEKGFQADQTIGADSDQIIGYKAYYEDSTLNKVSLEDNVKGIDDFAFARSSLKGIEIPYGVETIGLGAFYHCDKLSKVLIPESVKEIQPEAFEKTKFLDQFYKKGNDDFLIVGDQLLLAYKGDGQTVYIPDGVKRICSKAFQNHSEIEKLVLPDSIEIVDEAAFEGCLGLTTVQNLDKVKKIKDRAFKDCPLTKIHLGKELTEVGLGAFQNCASPSVVFENDRDACRLSYEKSASIYLNNNFRTPAFGDSKVAVIDAGFDDYEESIFDEDYLGFKGLVVSLPNGLDSDNRTAKLEYCTMLPNAGESLLKIPDYVTIDGKDYELISADKNAFKPLTKLDRWSSQNVSAVILPAKLGSFEEYEPDFEAYEPVEKTDATIVLDSKFPSAELMSVEVLDDDVNHYKLVVNDNEQNAQKLKQKVNEYFGTVSPGQLTAFELNCLDEKSNLPISTFGENQVVVKVPVSETLSKQDICAVTLDKGDKLELLYGTKETEDGQNYFVFRTSHFSPYGIYAGLGDSADLIRSETANRKQLDESPDTSDRSLGYWLLVIALGLFGAALLIYTPMTVRDK